ncbi:hypothetical protein AMTR_s00100p00049190, partial [Amborella trichopoda]
MLSICSPHHYGHISGQALAPSKGHKAPSSKKRKPAIGRAKASKPRWAEESASSLPEGTLFSFSPVGNKHRSSWATHGELPEREALGTLSYHCPSLLATSLALRGADEKEIQRVLEQ